METTPNKGNEMTANDRMKAYQDARNAAEYAAHLDAARRGDLGEVARQIIAKMDAAQKVAR